MIISIKLRPCSPARKLAYAVATSALIVSTAACDNLIDQNALSSITGDSSGVPEEIADLCMAYTQYTVRQAFEEAPNHFSAKNVKWEQNGENHIWRATLHNALEQRDIPVSFQFAVNESAADIRQCGTRSLRFDNGLVDGQYVNVVDFNQLFGKVFTALFEKFPVAEPESAPAPEPTPYIDNSAVDNSGWNTIVSNETVDDGADENSLDTGLNATNSY